jgi:hypothetical protein
MKFMVGSRGRDLKGWGVGVTVDIQDISLGDNSRAPFRNTTLPFCSAMLALPAFVNHTLSCLAMLCTPDVSW